MLANFSNRFGWLGSISRAKRVFSALVGFPATAKALAVDLRYGFFRYGLCVCVLVLLFLQSGGVFAGMFEAYTFGRCCFWMF